MYPLNMTKPGEQVGFALACDEAEHKALTAEGYEPGFQEPIEADSSESDGVHTVQSVRAQLDGLGIAYDKRLGLAKLLALIPA